MKVLISDSPTVYPSFGWIRIQRGQESEAKMVPTVLNSFEELDVLSEGLLWIFVFSDIFIQFSVLDNLVWVWIRIQFIRIIEHGF